MKINLMLPTYKRPLGLLRFIDSALKYADNVNRIFFSFCVNENDSDTKDFLSYKYFPKEENISVVWEKTKQPNLAQFWNILYEQTFPEVEIVSMVADDMEFKTRGWDTVLVNAFQDSPHQVVYFDDNYIAHEKLCVNMFTSRGVVDNSGHPFMCPMYAADMVDVVWYKVGKLTGMLRYFDSVILQHNHATKKPKDQWDETMMRLNPIQLLYSNDKKQHKIADIYAHRVAANLIKNGVGRWNIL